MKQQYLKMTSKKRDDRHVLVKISKHGKMEKDRNGFVWMYDASSGVNPINRDMLFAQYRIVS